MLKKCTHCIGKLHVNVAKEIYISPENEMNMSLLAWKCTYQCCLGNLQIAVTKEIYTCILLKNEMNMPLLQRKYTSVLLREFTPYCYWGNTYRLNTWNNYIPVAMEIHISLPKKYCYWGNIHMLLEKWNEHITVAMEMHISLQLLMKFMYHTC